MDRIEVSEGMKISMIIKVENDGGLEYCSNLRLCLCLDLGRFYRYGC